MTLQITLPLEGQASGDAGIPWTEWDLENADQPQAIKNGGVRKLMGWPLLLVMIVALWPAAWGGLTGFSVVDGTSMESAYDTNDVVLTLRQSSYAVGDIVSYKVPAGQEASGQQIIHRIVAVENSADEPIFSTQGDNDPSLDPWKISTVDVVGKVVLHAPGIGAAFSGVNGLFLATISGLVVLVGLGRSWSGAGKAAKKDRGEPSTIGHPSGF